MGNLDIRNAVRAMHPDWGERMVETEVLALVRAAQTDPAEAAHALEEALEFMRKDEGGMPWLHGWTLAHLRIPRVEVMEYTSIDEFHNVVAKLIVDKAMSALVTATWPTHE